jgi:UDP-N-acetylglucosamine 2-epimerase (non-hydrolysing)
LKRRIAVIFGTRPEIIKLSPIMKFEINSNVEFISISTGQQSELNKRALEDFQIIPKYSLELMIPNQALNTFLSTAIGTLHSVLSAEDIDCTIVHGDTSTALAAAIASFNLKIPVAHVEAGLRSYDLENPFPEEMNRRIISQLAKYHFSPTELSSGNLLKEGIKSEYIYTVGNTIVDVINLVRIKYKFELEDTWIVNEFKKYKKNVIFTVHRRENHGKLEILADVLDLLAKTNGNWGLWVPLHPNPNVRKKLTFLAERHPNLRLIEPLEYLDFISALMKCDLVVTDSGGIQEEATVLGKYCVVLRKTTERPELLSSGWGELTDFSKEKIMGSISKVLSDSFSLPEASSPFGDGMSSARIISQLISNLSK